MGQIPLINQDGQDSSWWLTSSGEKRGYIQPDRLDELWFHTGTACNLACPFCLEGSKPGDNRLHAMKFDEVKPLIDEALELGVQQFSFTGGEPFVIKDIVKILGYASQHRPCLVLTNGTDPLLRRLHQLELLRDSPQPVSFRISLDDYRPEKHDEGRGVGMFAAAVKGVVALQNLGFPVSVARQMLVNEDTQAVEALYHQALMAHGVKHEFTRFVAFPDFHPPCSSVEVPQITEHCMTHYHTEDSRRKFMCAYSKMVVKHQGQMRVYACTLVDDDPDYDLGGSLKQSLEKRVSMKHHRCYSCFAHGASCSEVA